MSPSDEQTDLRLPSPEQKVVQRWYEVFESGQLAGAGALFTEDLDWRITPQAPLAGDGPWTGRDRVFGEYFPRFTRLVGERLDGGWRMRLVRMRQDGDTVYAEGAYVLRGKGAASEVEAPFVHVWDFRGDRIARMTQYTDTAVIQQALGGAFQTSGS